jgi:hypothetical protein
LHREKEGQIAVLHTMILNFKPWTTLFSLTALFLHHSDPQAENVASPNRRMTDLSPFQGGLYKREWHAPAAAQPPQLIAVSLDILQ